MRVIGGSRRGFRLRGPASIGTRPMADKIKGSLFSMLAALDVLPDRVLDLYAGTGSVGIEALSRGAEYADFVEQNSAAAAVVRANLAHTRFTGVSRVHQMPVASFLRRAEPPYDLVIMDPPYADPAIVATLTGVAESGLVQSGSIVVVGHSPKVSLPEQQGRLHRLRERCHGDSCVSIFEIDGVPDGTGEHEGRGQDRDAGDLPGEL